MFITIVYTVLMALYVGIMVYRIKKHTFGQYLREETGFVAIFIVVSLTVKGPELLKEIYIPLVLLVFLVGNLRK
ncbi:hypothetical protein [Paenibacillus chibensis]|uniref:hypothetical protein n=1 Tax=Paenibacillus chibensis TaxID=59846 RepID=UPI000FD7B045|nr:hypothetical protein [Paenibacillus chibensis]MEC0371535.1 hypothetical protein [Paenibacillus chibensis]